MASKRILIVDDDATFRRLLADCVKRHLVQAGLEHEVHTASDANSALVNIRFQSQGDSSVPPYDLLIIDVVLSDRSGIELYKRIREEHPGLAGRVIFITGHAQARLEALDLDDIDCLFKPFDMDMLEGMIDRHLTQGA